MCSDRLIEGGRLMEGRLIEVPLYFNMVLYLHIHADQPWVYNHLYNYTNILRHSYDIGVDSHRCLSDIRWCLKHKNPG